MTFKWFAIKIFGKNYKAVHKIMKKNLNFNFWWYFNDKYNLNNTLLIIDEVHNVTGNFIGKAIQKVIDNWINLKIVLVWATPIRNLGWNVIELINFLKPKEDRMWINDVFDGKLNFNLGFKIGGEDVFAKNCIGYIWYYRGAHPLLFAKQNDKGE